MLVLNLVREAAQAAEHGEAAAHVSPTIALVGAFVGMLVVAAAVHALSKRMKMPFTVALVVVGAALAWLAGRVDVLAPLADLEVTPDVVLFVFLPTLIFQSAFHLDARALRENLAPTLTLAVPGLIVSTAVIGGIMHAAAPWVGVHLDWAEALLLGSILSATDPVAVIALFSQLGAPKRLTVLVEGESLFNDATAIVLSRIIIGVMAAGALTSETLIVGGVQFLAVFFGGLVVGWILALVAGSIIGEVEHDAFFEITLTTILAYLSFYVAEHWLHLSGVMAVVAAGVVIGGWGKAKITPAIVGYLEHFWDYLAGVANALIFLLVGLTVDLGALFASLPVLVWVVVAMLVSRALVIYTLVPLLGKMPGSDPIDRGYQTVMYWGGLRGGIALAIALSLPATVDQQLFITVATGAVLFTLLVQGLTIERVVKHFGLHVPPLSDRVARIEGLIAAKHRTMDEIPHLEAGGLFSPRIADEMGARCTASLANLRGQLDELREKELDLQEERRLLYLRCFGEEKTLYYRMFSNGHLGERTYRNLTHSIELQTEGIRHEARLPEFTLHPPSGERLETVLYRMLERFPGLGSPVERLRAGRAARDYEVAWARFRGSRRVLDDLEELGRTEGAGRADIVDEVRALYEYWHESARSRLDQTSELFPEFVAATQERLADRLALHAEQEAIEEKAHAGIIPHGVAEVMLQEMAHELRALRASQAAKLAVDPRELLKKVPFFQGIPVEEFHAVADRLRRRTAPAGDAIVKQGDGGSSLFLVARGVVRVSRQDGGITRDVATLMAGDFFGEMALLHGGARTATCRAVTPCALYELRREDLDAVLQTCPSMQQALEEADRRRRAELRQGGARFARD